VAARFEKPVLLFSGGKDSILLAHLAQKAFFPANIPFPFLHIDTGHNFEETISFRDRIVDHYGVKLIVASVEEAIKEGKVTEEKGPYATRNFLQTPILLEKLEKEKFDVAIGGGRRDEEKSRAKERFFSHRDDFGQWDPKNQRPELWNLYNSRKHFGEHFRVFPISNWTELDVWQYLAKEDIMLPSLYFAHQRKVFYRDGILLADNPFLIKKQEEVVEEKWVRCRTIGDMTCTGLWESTAQNIREIIEEIAVTHITERGGRSDDKRSETSMEDRKKRAIFKIKNQIP
jgi:sulfate adenylyltransferase subunit 2